MASRKNDITQLAKALGEALGKLDDLSTRVAELERAHRADVARDHASPYTCANQEKKR